MILKEVKLDLFRVPSNFYLAHCISSDFVMGAGIAMEFTRRGVRTYLNTTYEHKWNDEGYALYAPIKNYKGVYNLVTKEKYSDKPDYETLIGALISMRDQLPDDAYLAMPKIGCGLDKLEWSEVKEYIEELFEDTDMQIIICSI